MSDLLTKKREWVITGADGLDDLLSDELSKLGATGHRRLKGAIAVEGDLATGYRLCLWSRLASRVLMPLFSINSGDPDKLYHAALKHPWEDVLKEDATFIVRAAVAKGVSTHTRFASLRLKDGIVDRFRDRTGARPSVDTESPDVTLHVFIEAERISVSLDFSGDSLHKRGYRVAQTGAPLKENLAAAMLMLAGWPERGNGRLFDPLCGSGTVLIEAGLMWADAAPGLARIRFGFDGWAGHQPDLWRTLRDEAVARRLAGLEKPAPELLGFDIDADALDATQRNAQSAGIASWLELAQLSIAEWDMSPEWAQTPGLVATNPPYGERLSEEGAIRDLYRAIGRQLRQHVPGWHAVVLAADIIHADALGLDHRATLRLFNGALPIFARYGEVLPREQELPLSFDGSMDDLPAEVMDFANRLQKNLKAFLKQAAAEDVRCFRLYDADLPEFNLAIDVYDGRLHVQEYAPPKTVDPEKAVARFKLALIAIRKVMGLHRDKVFLKVRERQSGNQQYSKQGKAGKFFEVREGRARLLVNLTDYLDTGLFLDHRPLRLRLAEEAKDGHFLNLFAYTGTASVHAALGGAWSTTTVDLSPTYLAWANRNLALNGLPDEHHRLVQADVMAWLRQEQDDYDLIFVDPPTFSNSKRMDDIFDVQRDHVALLHLSMARLHPEGTLYFSNNFRKFQLDESLSADYDVVDISADTIGFDFARNPKIHRCWQLRHKAQGSE
jgi:23S rRNA (guanine2445-N2)-methyltransferase / 23S rRNA (guanine2069-N7)-methyltransferase